MPRLIRTFQNIFITFSNLNLSQIRQVESWLLTTIFLNSLLIKACKNRKMKVINNRRLNPGINLISKN
jgi:hypothetical protein